MSIRLQPGRAALTFNSSDRGSIAVPDIVVLRKQVYRITYPGDLLKDDHHMTSENDFFQLVAGVYAIWSRERLTGRISAELFLRHAAFQRGKVLEREMRVLRQQPLAIGSPRAEFTELLDQFRRDTERRDGVVRIVTHWVDGSPVTVEREIERNI